LTVKYEMERIEGKYRGEGGGNKSGGFNGEDGYVVTVE